MYELNIDLTNEELLSDRTSGVALQTAVVATENDRFTQRLYFLNRTGGISAPVEVVAIPPQYTHIALAGRPQDDLEEAGLLFSATGYLVVGAGSALHYEAILDLNTVALHTKLENKASLPVLIDIELRNAAATDRRTVIKQRLVTINRDIYRGTEGVPVEGDPAYPSPEAIALNAPANGSYKIEGGIFKLWNATQAIYQPVSLAGAAGAETLVIH